MSFFHAINAACSSHSPVVNIPEQWGQGRATFGGLVVAALYSKIAPEITKHREIRSLLASFVAPVAPGELHVAVEVLREGKGAMQLQVTGSQNNQVCTTVLASFGFDRESTVDIKGNPPPTFKGPDEVQEFPFIRGLTPDFTQFFDYRYTLGGLPFMGKGQRDMGGWIKLREEKQEPISVAALLALLDAWPPAVFSLFKKPVSGSSLTWAISFINTPVDCGPNDWWQYQADIQTSANGYSHIDARLWDKNKNLTVISRQTVSIFE
jgi:acyl-CoA thioesterase